MRSGEMYEMSATEIVACWVGGQLPSEDAPIISSDLDPRAAFDAEVLESVRRPPCGVAFSGGRDSSVILAAATRIARREGLPDPLPITNYYPDHPATDEGEWQELVIRHLELTEWVRLETHHELDLVGPIATPLLRRHGVLWPAMLFRHVPLLEVVPGGTLVNGQGGDEVLGAELQRGVAFTRLVRAPTTMRLVHLSELVRSSVPARWRVRSEWSEIPTRQPWLTAAGTDLVRELVLAHERARPLGFDRALRAHRCARAVALALHNEATLARSYDVAAASPFLAPNVVGALAQDGGWFGPGDRTMVLRKHFSDLLPDVVLKRRSKAEFSASFMSLHTRNFAAGWSGRGLDTEFVDVEVLRDSWRSDDSNLMSDALLQQAWLADHEDSRRG